MTRNRMVFRWRCRFVLVAAVGVIAGCTVSPTETALRQTSAESSAPLPTASPTTPPSPPAATATPQPDRTPSATPQPEPTPATQDPGLVEVLRAFDQTLAESRLNFVHSIDFGFRATSGVLSSADVVWTGVAEYPGATGWVVMNRGDFGDSHEVPEGASDSLGQIDAEIWRGQRANPVDVALLLRHLRSSLIRTEQSLLRDDGSSHWWVAADTADALPLLRGQMGTLDELAGLAATANAEMTVDVDIGADGTIEMLTLSLSDWWEEATIERGVDQQQWVSVAIEINTVDLDEAENECPSVEASERAGRYCEAARSLSA